MKKDKKVLSSKGMKKLLALINEYPVCLEAGSYKVEVEYLYNDFFWNNRKEYYDVILPTKNVLVKEIVKQLTPKLEVMANEIVEHMAYDFGEFQNTLVDIEQEKQKDELLKKEAEAKKAKFAKSLTSDQKKLFKEAYNITV